MLLAELNGERLFTAPDAGPEVMLAAVRSLMELTRRPAPVRPFRQIHVRSCNGTMPTADPIAALLSQLGFVRDAGQTFRYEGYL